MLGLRRVAVCGIISQPFTDVCENQGGGRRFEWGKQGVRELVQGKTWRDKGGLTWVVLGGLWWVL